MECLSITGKKGTHWKKSRTLTGIKVKLIPRKKFRTFMNKRKSSNNIEKPILLEEI